MGEHFPSSCSTIYGVEMSIREKIKLKREAYVSAGYECTDIKDDGESVQFLAKDQYGVTRQIMYQIPQEERVELVVPVVELPEEVKTDKPKKPRKKKEK